MNCYYHPNRQSIYQCSICGKPLCQECAVNFNSKPICKECAQTTNIQTTNISTPIKKKYNSFWEFVFSLFPGAGHMYLGLMNRGLQFMLLFLGIIIISNLFYAEYFSLLLILVWSYSFFDCYHIKKQIDNDETVKDEKIYNLTMKKINNYHIGIGLIIFGALLILNQMIIKLKYLFDFDYEIVSIVRNSLLPIVLIVIGIVILVRLKKQKEQKDTGEL